jgi:Reverse transcriptase (RNA-dependent DNA polymerase)
MTWLQFQSYSSVVHLEIIRTLLAMVPDKDLWISQMNVKGAYLNGKLQENIYICQPEGYTDGTDKVCHLLKVHSTSRMLYDQTFPLPHTD